MDIELFNEFLAKACDLEDWDREIYPAVWWRRDNSSDPRAWSKVIDDPNPYDLVYEFVAAGIHEGCESMLMMYGTMVKLDENDENDEETRTRVRVMLHFDGDMPTIAVQAQGSVAWIPEDVGEGLMPDTLMEAIAEYKNGEFANG